MESKFWSRLPEDCVERILARIPVPSIFRMRSVSKKWNRFIFSESFFALQAEFAAGRPCFLLCTQGKLACIFNFAVDKWHFVPVPRIKLPISVPPVSVVSAAGSLLCYGNQVAECSVLYVCNPFTRSLRQLPRMQRVRLIHKVSIVADLRTKSYKIMVAGEDGMAPFASPHVYKLHSEVYDSSTESWEMAACPLPDAKFGSDPGVWCLEDYFCITELPYGVVCFNLKAQAWSEIKAPLPFCLGSPSLILCNKRLLMVGRIMNQGGPLCKPGIPFKTESIRVWELNTLKTEWIELCKVPSELCSEFLEQVTPRTPFVCVGIGNLVCITTHLSPSILLYDVCSKQWRWLPRDPLFPKCRNFHLLGFPLEPRLDVQP